MCVRDKRAETRPRRFDVLRLRAVRCACDPPRILEGYDIVLDRYKSYCNRRNDNMDEYLPNRYDYR